MTRGRAHAHARQNRPRARPASGLNRAATRDGARSGLPAARNQTRRRAWSDSIRARTLKRISHESAKAMRCFAHPFRVNRIHDLLRSVNCLKDRVADAILDLPFEVRMHGKTDD